MMETLITLPIYIVFLSGLFWLGDTSISRLALIDGENFTLWNNANRHGTPAGPYLFWFLDTEGEATAKAGIKSTVGLRPSSESNSWGGITQGHIEGSIKRSGWSWGAAESVRAYYSETETAEPSGKDYLDLLAKGGNVMILSRRGDGGRSGNTSYVDSTDWHGIALGNWREFIVPTSDRPSSRISTYYRNASYIGWSR